jgi:tetratricopeptide (TPR) repeat protein
MNLQVNAWKENITLPTYKTGASEKNPMFLEKRVYQGSSGVVYPHPVIEKIFNEKTEEVYKAIFLENEFLKIMILPELGGRIQMAYDKIRQRHFVYYNQVIKPALVGLTGPWISGGIEFNWPQHHRPSTFEPVDCTIVENKDGSKTVWVNEVERMFRTKGMAGFTLYPDKAYLEITGKLYNRTPFPQTFLWWANPAVKVDDDYQSVFPPDVHAVFDHGKRDVSSFPIATGTYYKVNYAPGTDISRYKNIPVPTSYMAVHSDYDFIGGYEHNTKAGMLHVANHHLVPGKKQWTWGNGEFGRAWDRNLTDEDGPYIELMTGAFTDNQPDFSWLQPFEQKTFAQYFMPYAELGVVKNASKEAAIGLELVDHSAVIKLYVTARYERLQVALSIQDKELYKEEITSSPGQPYMATITLDEDVDTTALQLTVTNLENNKVLVSYKEKEPIAKDIPPPAKAARKPSDIESNEQLYLSGMHLEQYRHATYIAADYYEEALRRDSTDIRNNNALGLWFLRRGKFAKAESYFKAAIETLTERNPNPYNGESYYNLGLSLIMQNKREEAFNAFYKCVWNGAWQHAGYMQLARIACSRNDFEEALECIEKSIIMNYQSHTARHLKAVVLRKLDRHEEAGQLIEESLGIDPFNYGCLFEKYLLQQHKGEANNTLHQLHELSRDWVHNFIEYAFDYAHAGLYKEASGLLQLLIQSNNEKYPMLYYYLGWFAYMQQHSEQAANYFRQAAVLSPDFCFPNRIEDVAVLQFAMQLHPKDAKAPYYLGNFWYDKRQYEDAIQCWEQSVSIDDSFATVHRNLSLAYFNKLNNPAKARAAMEKAFALDTTDARVLMELDQLYKSLNVSPTERLEFLDKYIGLVNSRDDLYLERITLLNQTTQYKEALRLLLAYQFHPWEGGEGKTVKQFLVATIELSKQALDNGNAHEALRLLNNTESYPQNLGEGKLYGTQENDIDYLKGLSYDLLNNQEAAKLQYKKATQGVAEPVQAIFYNDPQPDKIFYQGLAWIKLGNKDRATAIFNRFIQFANEHLNDVISIDYFAVSLPDLLVFETDLNKRNKVHCLYIMALGYWGLGKENVTKAQSLFDEVLKLDKNHQGAAIHRNMIKYIAAEEVMSERDS